MAAPMLLPPDFQRRPTSLFSPWHFVAWPCQQLTYTSLLYVLAHVVWTIIGLVLLLLVCLFALCVDGPQLLCQGRAHFGSERTAAYHRALFAWLKVDVCMHNLVCLTSERIPLRPESDEEVKYLLEVADQSYLIDDASLFGIRRLVVYLVAVRAGLTLLTGPWLYLTYLSVFDNAAVLVRMAVTIVRSPDELADAAYVVICSQVWRWDARPVALVVVIVAIWYLVLILRQPLVRLLRSQSRDRPRSRSRDRPRRRSPSSGSDDRVRRRHNDKRSRKPAESDSESSSDSDSSDSSSDDDTRRDKKSSKKLDRKHKKGKKKSRTKDKKKGKKKKSSNAVDQNEYGKYGILRETDFHAKAVSFQAWLRDIKKIADFNGPKYEAVEYFKEYMEDYNTATMPHEKYYDIEKYEMKKYNKKMAKKMKRQRPSAVEDEESAHRERMRKKAEESRRDFELILATMDRDKIADMRHQQQLRDQMQMHYKAGNLDEARRIEHLLTKKDDKKPEPEFKPDF
ncbi:hypothetical protein ACHHYP_03713 [Achlya hypogyna]|uniref:Transmembrane protein n=1 Tax=Achlya hypogyna TaxID=1202772 RepID=A0A1V9Z389_ACHHY|nr:hypothetical protein ACHHYP_03713 [Achlya hypogyna]